MKFWVNEVERALIYEGMEKANIGRIGDYLRKMAVNGYIVKVDHSVTRRQTAEIQKIGVNINQIAKRINQTSRIYDEDIAEIKKLLEQIWHTQRYTLSKGLL